MNTVLKIIIVFAVLYMLLEIRNHRERPFIRKVEEMYADALEGRFKGNPVLRRRFVRALTRYACNPSQAKLAYAQFLTAERRAMADADRNIARLFQGCCQEAMGDPDAAIELYDSVCDAEPEFARAHIYRAHLLSMAGETASIEAYETVIRLCPNDAVQYNNYGSALIRLNRPADAVAKLEKALSLDPELTAARGLLALAYARMGDKERAQQAFEDAVAHGADAEELRKNMK